MNVSLQKILYQLLILAVPLLVSGQTSILLETIEGLPVEYSFTSSPMPPGTSIAPTHGTHTLVASGALNTYLLTYTPNDGFIGQDFIRVTRWTCSIVSQCFQYLDIYITVVPAQVRAYQDNVVTNVNTPVTINVLSNDYSSRGILIINSVSSVNNGSASFTPGGANIVFTPKPDFEGVAFLNYIVCDDENNCDNGNVSIHVRGISPPATDTVHIFTHKNTPQVVLVPPGFQRISGPSSGTYNDAGVALPEYRPNNNFTGLDYITYSDGTRQVIAQIRVLNTNFNQFAKDDVAYTTPGVAVEFNVLENDAFGTSAIMFSIVQQPANGTLVVGPENGLVVYIPNSGFSGTDKFKYSSRRPFGAGNLETATATVYVSNFEPSSATYYMNTPKVTPLVIGNNVPVPNFQFFVTDEPDFGEVLILPGEVDTVIYGRHIKGYNMVLYVPNSDVSDELDEFELVYCVTADASGAGCSFTRTVKVEIEILDIGTGAEPMCFGDCVWTGDTNFDGVVNMEDLLPIGWYMGEAGIPRADNNPALWYGKYGNNWDNPFADFYVDLKHLDADGNGYVSAHDTVAIHNFYGRTHSIVATKAPQSEYTINLTGNLFAGPGDVVELNMILGTTNQPVLNVYGLTFPFAYYPGLFVPESVQVNFSHNGWLAYNSPILFMNRNNMEGLLETGFTRTTGVSASGHGVIGTVRLIIEDDLAGIRLGDEILSVEVGGGTSTMMNAAGQTFGIEIGKANIRIRYHNEEEPVTADDLKIWPNPVGDYLNVHLNGGKDFSRIVVYNLMGQVVFNSGAMQARNAQIGVSHLPNGIYVLSVHTPDGPVNKKVEVIKK
jgi:hypothetical protein